MADHLLLFASVSRTERSSCAWCSLFQIRFSICAQEPVFVHTSRELVLRQCAVLRSSQKTDRECDLLLSAHVELIALLAQMKGDLGELSTINASQDGNVIATVQHYNSQYNQWSSRWVEAWKWMEEGRVPQPGEPSPLHLELAQTFAKMFIHAHASE